MHLSQCYMMIKKTVNVHIIEMQIGQSNRSVEMNASGPCLWVTGRNNEHLLHAILLGSEYALRGAHRVEAILTLHAHALAETTVVAGSASACLTIALVDFG